MRRVVCFAALAAIFGVVPCVLSAVRASTPSPTSAPVTPAATGTKIILPGGTPLTVRVQDKISSQTANAGDLFTFDSADEVAIDGWIAIQKGATGQGEVIKVDRAGKNGHAGSLGLQLDWIYAADGNKVRLSSQPSNAQGEGKGGTSSTVTIISTVFFLIPGLFAHNFVNGKDVIVDSSNPLHAYVNESVYVAASLKSTEGHDFAPSASSSSAPAFAPSVASPAPR